MLTIAMPHFYDHHSTLWFTLTCLSEKIIDAGLQGQVEIVVCDNSPHLHGKIIAQLTQQYGAKYVALPGTSGTAAPRNMAIQQATQPWTLMMDAHVLLRSGTLEYVAQFIKENPDSKDLYYGPLLASHIRRGNEDDDKVIWTEWEPVFGSDAMFGKAKVDERGIKATNPPYEIRHSGTGLFLCRTEDFLWYHPEFKGFGLEGYMTAKYISQGRKVWCLPGMRWVHWFRPKGLAVPYQHGWFDRMRNGILQLEDINPHPHFDVKALHEAFVLGGKCTQQEWDMVMQERRNKAMQAKMQPSPEKGMPGTELARILASIGVVPAEDCDCKQKVQLMDQWGVEGCRANYWMIVGWLKDGQDRWGWQSKMKAASLAVRSGLAFRINWRDPFPGIVREAIEKADKARQEKALEEAAQLQRKQQH